MQWHESPKTQIAVQDKDMKTIQYEEIRYSKQTSGSVVNVGSGYNHKVSQVKLGEFVRVVIDTFQSLFCRRSQNCYNTRAATHIFLEEHNTTKGTLVVPNLSLVYSTIQTLCLSSTNHQSIPAKCCLQLPLPTNQSRNNPNLT